MGKMRITKREGRIHNRKIILERGLIKYKDVEQMYQAVKQN
jgi:hypothetical protein